MKHILAFGDSNTWGLIPGQKERYPENVRWTGIINSKDEEINVIEEGLCGRTTIFEDELRPGRRGVELLPVLLESHYPLDAAILMLGTNDCKATYNASPYLIGEGIERCLKELEKHLPKNRILLVSPIELGDEVYKPEKDPEFDERSIRTSKALKNVYQAIARKYGVSFVAASDYAKASRIDDEHLSEEGHRILADTIYDHIVEMKKAG